MNFLKKNRLEIVVFVTGAVVMIFELLGSRIIGPFAGTSIFVWTSLIGVILASLSVGYSLGGRLADQNRGAKFLANVILFSAGTILLVAIFRDLVPMFFSGLIKNMELRTLFISIVLFSPTSVLLGIVAPFAVRLRLESIEGAGRTVGRLYSTSTIGSIFGTFLAGFYLIPSFGTLKVLVILFFALVFTAFLLKPNFLGGSKSGLGVTAVGAILLLSAISMPTFWSTALADVDTLYNRIIVYSGRDGDTGRPTVNLATDPYGTQSAMFTDIDDDLVFAYTKFYRLASHFNPNISKALMIGGCGYSFPRDFLKRNSGATLDVVEIDPKMTELARQYFNLKDDPRLRIFHEDGRVYLNESGETYDAIFIDAFNSFSSVPYQMTTVEAVRKAHGMLNENGVVLINLISAVRGDKGKFLRAEYLTYKEVFPEVLIFPVTVPENGEVVQNIMLVAMKSAKGLTKNGKEEELDKYLTHLWTGTIERDVPVLTDDYAPVEYYKYLSVE